MSRMRDEKTVRLYNTQPRDESDHVTWTCKYTDLKMSLIAYIYTFNTIFTTAKCKI